MRRWYEVAMARRILGSELRARLGCLDPVAQLVNESECSRSDRVRASRLQVGVLRVRPDGARKCAREHPEGAYTAREVAMLKASADLCDHIVSMNGPCDGAANEAAMHSAHEQPLERAQLQEALVQASKAARK